MRFVRITMSLLSLGLLFGSPSASAAFKIRTVHVGADRYLLFADVARFYGMTYSETGGSVECRSRYSLMRFTVRDRRAQVNGVKVMLAMAVKSDGRNALLSEIDFRRTIDPILRTKVLSGRGLRTIVIDPGHGGADSGANGDRSQEKSINLAVAKLVAYNLKRMGYGVYMTRDSDRKVSLQTRVAAAARLKPDVFVSLHVNSGPPSAKGIETFAVTPVGTTSTHSSEEKTKPTPGNLHDRENTRLAYELQKNLLGQTRAADRGVKRANFVVIRDAPCPSALVEMGFISNSREESRLLTRSYQRQLAGGIVYGIIAYDKALRADN